MSYHIIRGEEEEEEVTKWKRMSPARCCCIGAGSMSGIKPQADELAPILPRGFVILLGH